MSRKRNRNKYHDQHNQYKTLTQLTEIQGNKYFQHYMTYLNLIAYQLFEWEGLPESIDPRYLEVSLHTLGSIAIVEHPANKTLFVAQGSTHGRLNIYGKPQYYQTAFPNNEFNFTAKIYNYGDELEDQNGVIIANNDLKIPTTHSLSLFAEDLAETKQISMINVKAQKNPWVMVANDKNLFSLKNLYAKIENGDPLVIIEEGLDPEAIKVHLTPTPYVADKLADLRDTIWAESLTFMGIKNANNTKKERLISDEVNSNNEQTTSSLNMWLAERQRACDLINKLFGLNVSVKVRSETLQEWEGSTLE